MALETPPWATSGGSATYTAEQTRRALFFWAGGASSSASGAGGIRNANDLLVQAPASGLSVNVGGYSTSNHDEILIPGSSTSIQGLYYGRMTSQSSLTITSNSSGNPRIDLVYAQVQDSGYSGSSNAWVVAAATGTPTSGATLSNLSGAPSVPTSAIALAYVLVPNGAGSIVSADILNVVSLARTSIATWNTYTVSVNTTAAPGDAVVVTGSSAVTITLPPALPGTRVLVTNAGTGTVTIATPGSIIGIGPAILSTQGASAEYIGVPGGNYCLVAGGGFAADTSGYAGSTTPGTITSTTYTGTGFPSITMMINTRVRIMFAAGLQNGTVGDFTLVNVEGTAGNVYAANDANALFVAAAAANLPVQSGTFYEIGGLTPVVTAFQMVGKVSAGSGYVQNAVMGVQRLD